MTNPFANAGASAAPQPAPQPAFAPQAAPAFVPQAPPAQNGFGGGQQFADAPSTNPAPAAGGDPFSDPGGSSKQGAAALVGRLLLCKPLEIIASMQTGASKDPAENVVRAHVAVLDDPTQPGRLVENMLWFQTGPKRDLGDIFRDPGKSLLLGRLARGEQKNPEDKPPYYFVKATDEEKSIAKMFLDARPF